MKRKHFSYPCHVITLPDTLQCVKPCFHWSAFVEPISQKLPVFSGRHTRWCHRSNGYTGIGSYLFHSQAAVFHNHLFHSRNQVFRSASAWPRLLRVVFTRRSAFFELQNPRTQIFLVHNVIFTCLTQLLMNFDGFHTMQVDESDNHALFIECKHRHYQCLKHYCHLTTSQAFNG